MDNTASPNLTLAQKAKREMIRYLTISAYLYVCFGALILYKSAILRAEGVPFTAFGLAVAKALILGKFMLLAETFKFGERAQAGRIAAQILTKSLLFASLLIVLTFIEEVIVGLVHGRKALDVAMTFAGGTLPQVFASALLMVLIMVPYFAFGEISASMGEGQLRRLLTEIRPRDGGA
jgi:hypothetical protein